MTRIIVLLALLLWSIAPARAQATPAVDGYMLVEPQFPAVTFGQSVPIFVHLAFEERTAERGVMRISFLTAFEPIAEMCAKDGDCDRIDRPLRIAYRVEDGIVQVEEAKLETDAPIVARQENDLIVAPVVEAIDGARMVEDGPRLMFEDVGDTFANGNLPSPVTFTRATLAQAFEAILATTLFDLSLTQTGPCAQGAVAALHGKTDRSSAENELLLALRYARFIQEAQDRADRIPMEERLDRSKPQDRSGAILSGGMLFAMRALQANPEASDIEILEERSRFAAKFAKGIPDPHLAFGPDADAGLVALVRHRHRGDLLRRDSGDLGRMLCENPTLRAD